MAQKRKIGDYFTQTTLTFGKKQVLELGDLLKSLPDDMVNHILEFLWWSEPCEFSKCGSRCRTQVYVERMRMFGERGVSVDHIHHPRFDGYRIRLCCKCAFRIRAVYLYKLPTQDLHFDGKCEEKRTAEIRDHFKRKAKGMGFHGEKTHTLGVKIQEYQTKIIDFILGKSNDRTWIFPKVNTAK